MTEATGSQNPSSQPASKAPWEQAWNDVKAGLSVIGESMSDTFVPKTPPGMPSPWERMWGSDKPKEKPPVVAPKQSATTDGSWDEINKKYAQGKPERDKSQLAILQNELASVTNPRHKAMLEREIAGVTGAAVNPKQGEGSTVADSDSKRKQYEALPVITGKEILDSGMDVKSNREAWYAKMEKEWKDGQKGMSRAQKDKYFSNPEWLAKTKYPKEYALWSRMQNEGVDGFNDNVKSVLSKNFKYSLVDTMASEGGASGWVYSMKGDRAFLGQSANIKTLVHETEHLEQHKDWEENKFKSTSYEAGKIGSYNEPINRLQRWTDKNKEDPAVREVFSADNAYDNNDEWMANLAAHWKTSIPKGKSWSDTAFYKKLEKSVGKEEAHTMMIDALMTITRSAPYTRNR